MRFIRRTQTGSAQESRRRLATEEEVLRTTSLTEQMLADAGYEQYEVSNFARAGYACRHNIGYRQRVNYLGLGIGAASLMENIRYTNVSDLYKYLERTAHIKEELRKAAADDDRDSADRPLRGGSEQAFPRRICMRRRNVYRAGHKWRSLCFWDCA